MHYTTVETLPFPVATVMAALADPATWPGWQSALTDVEQISPTERELTFETADGVNIMSETLLRSDSTHYDAIYRMDGFTNECLSTLEPVGEETRWTMVNTWELPDDVEIPQAAFEAQSREAMLALADYLAD